MAHVLEQLRAFLAGASPSFRLLTKRLYQRHLLPTALDGGSEDLRNRYADLKGKLHLLLFERPWTEESDRELAHVISELRDLEQQLAAAVCK